MTATTEAATKDWNPGFSFHTALNSENVKPRIAIFCYELSNSNAHAYLAFYFLQKILHVEIDVTP